ncbi:chaperonin 10-like protein [Paraphoma chrysanthemicola]|nr:chaperonin 10-like protein [Paraphoma chrysanthemicola]
MVTEGIMGTPLPCTGSHEGAGTIVAVGSAVEDFCIGERVMAGIIYHACGTCSDRQGPENFRQYCQFSGGYCGVTTHGFFAEYARIDATQAAKLPDAVTFETAAPLACAGCTIYRGVVLSGLKKGVRVVPLEVLTCVPRSCCWPQISNIVVFRDLKYSLSSNVWTIFDGFHGRACFTSVICPTPP